MPKRIVSCSRRKLVAEECARHSVISLGLNQFLPLDEKQSSVAIPFDVSHLWLFQTVDDVLVEGPGRSFLNHNEGVALQGRKHVGIVLAVGARGVLSRFSRIVFLFHGARNHVGDVHFVEHHTFLATRQRSLEKVERDLNLLERITSPLDRGKQRHIGVCSFVCGWVGWGGVAQRIEHLGAA